MKKCPFCAEDVQDAAIVCKHCGRELSTPQAGTVARASLAPKTTATKPVDQPKAMWPVGALIVGLVFVLRIVNQNSPRTTGSVVAPESIRAVELFAAYYENEVAADQRFKGRRLIVTGQVKDIGKDITDTAYLMLGDNPDILRGTQAFFPATEASGLVRLKRGATVELECVVAGKALTNVILQGCSLR